MNTILKYYWMFLLLSGYNHIVWSQEIGNDFCNISYATPYISGKDTILGVDLYIDKAGNLIFEWPNMVGPAYMRQEGDIVFIDCTGVMMSRICDSIDYFEYRFATVVVDLRSCSIEKQLNRLNDYLPDTPEKLCARYRTNLLKYKRKQRIQKDCSNANYIRLYAYQLLYAALTGSAEATRLYQRIPKDYRLFNDGLDAVEHRMNTKIIRYLGQGL